MLHPSYTDLMNALNSNVKEGSEPIVQSRYSVVMAAAKRARQIVDGADILTGEPMAKPLSTAIREIYEQEVSILPSEPAAE